MSEISDTNGLTRNIQQEATQASTRRASSRGEQGISADLVQNTGSSEVNPRSLGDTTAESFEKQLDAIWGESTDKVTEKQVYVSAVRQRLDSLEFGGDGRKIRFLEHYNDIVGQKGDDRQIFAAVHALKRMTLSGQLGQSEARQIRQEAFGAAQQDSDPYRLINVVGAVETFDRDTAVTNAASMIDDFESGDESRMTRRERKELRAAADQQDDGE